MGLPKPIFRRRITPIITARFSANGSTKAAATASSRAPHGVALESSLGQACTEEAFRHFLSIEAKRSRRSGRPFHLLLVRVRTRATAKGGGTRLDIDPEMAAKLFACLWLSLRETDLVGWFRDSRVAGALLTHMADAPARNVGELICEKVRKSLRESLPSDFVQHLDVRAVRLPSNRITLK
jgi:hypothetical protein